MKQLYPEPPFIYDGSNNIIGIRNSDGSIYYFALSLPEAQTPVNGVQASITTNMTNPTSDVTLTAVEYGKIGNDITVTYVDPAGNNKALAVSVSGKDITVSLATGAGGAITSTAALVKAAINGSAAASALVTAEDEGAGTGVVNAVVKASLTGGVDVTPGVLGCLCYLADNPLVYRKTAAQTWTAIASPTP